MKTSPRPGTPVFEPGTLVVLVGAPGAGKTTFAGRYPATWRVSLDTYRELATDDMADQTATPVAAQIQALLVDARLARGLTSLIDSTNIHPHVRTGLLARARYWQRPAAAVLFTAPLDVCQARNATRTRHVPDGVLRELHHHMPTAHELRAEGFTTIHTTTDR